MNDLPTIERFLAGRRIAMVGVSTKPQEFSRAVWRAFVERGYDMVPVHPGVDEIDGRKAFARVADVPGAPDGVLVMVPAAAAADVVADCVNAGVRRVWLHRGAGAGAVSDAAVALAREHGLELVAGECPLMFLPGTERVHRWHGGWRKLIGRYPGRSAAGDGLKL
jgi:predicted CoA-binding protein